MSMGRKFKIIKNATGGDTFGVEDKSYIKEGEKWSNYSKTKREGIYSTLDSKIIEKNQRQKLESYGINPDDYDDDDPDSGTICYAVCDSQGIQKIMKNGDKIEPMNIGGRAVYPNVNKNGGLYVRVHNKEYVQEEINKTKQQNEYLKQQVDMCMTNDETCAKLTHVRKTVLYEKLKAGGFWDEFSQDNFKDANGLPSFLTIADPQSISFGAGINKLRYWVKTHSFIIEGADEFHSGNAKKELEN
jgi:hypothetical protein